MKKNNKIEPFSSLSLAISSIGGVGAAVVSTERVHGGDTNASYALTLQNGKRVFMKANQKSLSSIFASEAEGLSALASCKKIGVGKVLAFGEDKGDENGYSFLLMEYINSTEKNDLFWQTLGRELAELHKAKCASFVKNGKYGFENDNYIGKTLQINDARSSWIDFFRDCRLIPQLKKASSYFDSSFTDKIDKFLKKLDSLLIEPEFPSILHGDLWNGNIMCGQNGKPFLVDPACYVGHYEIDLAMTQLFGGFPDQFYASYWENNPNVSGYETRRDIYNLYHLLNHLNLFGQSYLKPVQDIIKTYVD